jgi:lycopene cyclase domain-containing protein
MGRYSYLAVLAAIVLGSLWLELVIRTRVFLRLRRIVLTVIPVVLAFLVWDAVAVAWGHWTFDVRRILGSEPVAGIPIEEIVFFAVVPLASVLTFEAVRAVRGWPAGDEPISTVDDRR